ncbi:Predicted membrane protein [Georgenia satyanarayanai]|uniref:Predicted membrane protein n=1 Tax=Georgenia satyanarayanai TaxID=860221 RepID=A0A2Y9AIK5_9MICO|nr:DUF2079 domain-containing protein [Georgenia satyanarayanai]PYF99023.1 putative membrane protein DUF2079 [Georgenia satyanarayanai]SSA43985.1 Predicted membrane protein [Georgenia satyanarayanai]
MTAPVTTTRRARLGQPEAWGVAVAGAALYALVAVLQWRRLEAPSWDLAIFTQLAKAYAGLDAPIVPIKGDGFNLLGDHFHPVLVLLGPVYAVAPSGLSLLVVQALLVGVSAWPLTALAVRWLGRRPGLAVGAAYVLSHGVQGAVRSQFHEVAFALPLLAFGLRALLERRWRASVLWLAPLVLVKEDLGLLVAVLGLVIWWRGARRAGLALAGWGVAWFVLATAVILPALNPRGQYDYTDRLTVGDVVGDPLGALAGVLGPGEKVVTVLLLVLAAGVVGVRSPILLAAVPTLAWRFLGEVEFYWTWVWHYDAVLMPLATAALLDALGPRPAEPDRRRPPRVAVAIGAAWLAVVLTVPDLPVVRLASPDTWQASPRTEAAREVVGTVPQGAVVASDISLLARLVPTTTALWSGTADNPVADYYVIDRQGGTWGGDPPEDAARYAEDKHPGTDYELVLDREGYQVARRVG